MIANFPLAFSFELEGLLPILLFLLYGVSQLLSSRKKKGEEVELEETAEMRQENEAEEDRARQIREEIQRRVEQQRSQAAATKAATEQAAAAKAKREEPVKRWTRQESHATAARNAREQPQMQAPAVAGLEVQLKEQRQKLAAAKRSKSNAQREARSMANSQSRSNRYKAATTAAMDPNLVSKEIRAILSQPSSARQGIILSEILGAPMATRNFTSERNI